MHKKVDVEKLSDDAILNAAAILFSEYIKDAGDYVITGTKEHGLDGEQYFVNKFVSFFERLKVSLQRQL